MDPQQPAISSTKTSPELPPSSNRIPLIVGGIIALILVGVVSYILGVKSQQNSDSKAIPTVAVINPTLEPTQVTVISPVVNKPTPTLTPSWKTVNGSSADRLKLYSFQVPPPQQCNGCFDSNGTTYTIRSRGDNADWLFMVSVYKQTDLPLKNRDWSILPGNFFDQLSSMQVNETKQILDITDNKSYSFTRNTDTTTDGEESKVYTSNLSSQNLVKSKRVVIYKDGYVYSLILEWNTSNNDLLFDQIIETFQFRERKDAPPL